MTKTFQSFVLIALLGTPAAAADLPVVPQTGCPSESEVKAELERILPGTGAAIAVTDLGAGVRLSVNGAERTFANPSRDCGERARTAALAAAMILSPPSLPAVVAVAPPAQPLPVAAPAASTAHPIDAYSRKGRSEVIAGGILLGASLLLGGVGAGLFGDGVNRGIDHLFEKGYDNSANATEVGAGFTLAVLGGGAAISGIVLTAVGAYRRRHPRPTRWTVTPSVGSSVGLGFSMNF